MAVGASPLELGNTGNSLEQGIIFFFTPLLRDRRATVFFVLKREQPVFS